MERMLNNLHIPEQWHNLVVLMLCILFVWALNRFIKYQISKTDLGNDIQYKAKKAVTFGVDVAFIFVAIIIYNAYPDGFLRGVSVVDAGTITSDNE